MRKFWLLAVLVLMVMGGCSAQRRSSGVVGYVQGFKGDGKVVWRGDEISKSSSFYYVISKTGKMRMDFVTFWGQTAATLIYDGKLFTFYMPFNDVVYRGKDIEVEGIPSILLVELFKAVFWGEEPEHFYTVFKDGKLKRFMLKNGRVQGRVRYGDGIKIFFRAKGKGKGEIRIDEIKPLSSIDPATFKLNLPDDVRIKEVE